MSLVVIPMQSGFQDQMMPVQAAGGSGLPDDLILAINWNSGLGATAAAVLDENKTRKMYDLAGAVPDYFEVRDSSDDGRSWAPPTYLRMTPMDTPSADGWGQLGFDLANGAYIPSWVDGDGILIRYYYRNVYPFVSLDQDTHGDEWLASAGGGGTCGASTFGWTYEYQSAPTWRVCFSGVGGIKYGPGFGFGQGQPFSLAHGTEYRLQFGVRRESSTTMSLFGQIYAGGVGGALLHDHADFDRQGYDNEPALNIVTDAPFTVASNYWTCGLREWWMGLNGITGLTTANDGQTCFEWAGLAMRFGQGIDFDEPWEFDAAELTWSP